MNRFTRFLQKPFKYKDFNVTYILIGINVAIFFIGFMANSFPSFTNLIPALLGLSFTGVVQFKLVYQFFTYMFVHDLNSIFHIFFNMFTLYMIGRPLEQRLGSKEFLLYYLLCGTFAGIFHFLIGGIVFAATGSFEAPYVSSPLIGASGAVFAVIFAYGILFSESTLYFFGVLPVKARKAILIFGGIELLSLFSMNVTHISNITHIGGLIAGILYFFIRKRINPFKILFPPKNTYDNYRY